MFGTFPLRELLNTRVISTRPLLRIIFVIKIFVMHAESRNSRKYCSLKIWSYTVIVLPFLFTVSQDHCWIVYQVILSTVIFLVALPVHTHCILYRQTRESEKLKVVQSLDDWRLSLPVPSMFRIHVNQLVALKVTCNWH